MNKLRLILILSFAIFLTGCSDDYEQFKTLFPEGYDEESMSKTFGIVREAVSDSASIDTFTLVTFDNGKSLLVHFTPIESEDGEVLIQDIIELPTEMATYIEEELNKKYDR